MASTARPSRSDGNLGREALALEVSDLCGVSTAGSCGIPLMQLDNLYNVVSKLQGFQLFLDPKW